MAKATIAASGNPAIAAEVKIIREALAKSPAAWPRAAREALARIEKLTAPVAVAEPATEAETKTD